MTQTASFKDKLKTAYSFFKWELKACSGTLAVYAILAAVFTIITFTLCIVGGNGIKSSEVLEHSIKAFEYIASNIVYFLTIIFTIIYTIRVYSYLHNKRKADLYGSLPVSRVTLFLSKSVTAFAFSIIPALFFLGIISIITVCFGQPVISELSAMYLKLIMGSLSCISAYGLLAVCCGTSINAVMMFIVVCIAYPLSAIFIRGVAGGFFIGLYSGILQDNFIMNALNPLAAYDGINTIYWLIFTVVCTLGGCFLAKRRKYERAQTSFAYYLPCHIIKVLIAFLVGMFLGVIFGSLNVLGYGLTGFIFGFILGSVPAFVITHLIFYKGFKKLLVTSIPLGGLIVAVIAIMTVCNFDVFGYNNYIPHANDVKMAGFVDLDYCYSDDNIKVRKLAKESCDDFSDSETINEIIKIQTSYVNSLSKHSSEKFEDVLEKIFTGAFSLETPQYCFGYTLENGKQITRIYSTSIFENYENDIIAYSVIYSKEYFTNYGVIYNTDRARLTDLAVTTTAYNTADVLGKNTKSSVENSNKILDAFCKDFEADTNNIDSVLAPLKYTENEYIYSVLPELTLEDFSIEAPDAVCILSVGYKGKRNNQESLFDYFVSGLYNPNISEDIIIPKSYTNTINALKEAGILNDDLTLNEDCEYYEGSSYYASEYDYLY